ncbi:type II secretion system protein GspG [Paradesulfitobacterium ferrireducens]|uniref:type II secretion system protein GspG n=1 Tax=Paradesulfitobacterium ferrireducens TaxID=2816476 RepID=UPI001A8DB0AB|nr:type II secretion system protein GspG [Paradesulfitobacterium ferrireducens]
MQRLKQRLCERFVHKEEGFTLYEVLLVLLLMGLVLRLAVPNFATSHDGIKRNVDEANIKKIEGAAQLYRLDVGAFPGSVADLMEPPAGVSAWNGPYLEKLPVNPFEPTQSYELNSIGQVRELH